MAGRQGMDDEGTYARATFVTAVAQQERAGTSAVGSALGCAEKTAYKRLRARDADSVVGPATHDSVLVWQLLDS